MPWFVDNLMIRQHERSDEREALDSRGHGRHVLDDIRKLIARGRYRSTDFSTSHPKLQHEYRQASGRWLPQGFGYDAKTAICAISSENSRQAKKTKCRKCKGKGHDNYICINKKKQMVLQCNVLE